MQRIYQEGGKANKIMLSPKLRRDFSDLMVTDSGVRRNIDMDGKLRQSVDIYMSDFGDLMLCQTILWDYPICLQLLVVVLHSQFRIHGH